ncbi:MAG TPA: response regulator [Thermodesulfobacteriota bacterium]|nr:response regulator [Thermodesulfobacteriota bacterium]
MIRILIIEDDEEMRALLRDSLVEEGIEFDSAGNGSEAIRKLVEGPFDLVITDIRMPGLTGLDLLPGIKKLQPETFVIVITAFGGEEVRRKSFDRGATAYLEKPINMNRLKTLVQEMVSAKEKGARV